jgi:NAD(P)-dependent dehydrogenase (short-subunit alcohol dehydrogenase family)
MQTPKTAIVTGASQGIGACLVKTLLARGYRVVATARSMEKSGLQASQQLALVDGDIGEASTARHIAATAIEQFGDIDTLVNNAGIFFTKPFPEYTTEDVGKLISTNLYGFFYLTQLVIKQMQQQRRGECGQHYDLTGRSPHRRDDRFCADDDQRGHRVHLEKPGDGICQSRHSL